MDNQCTSCGGFCGKVCKRLNVVDTMSEKREWVGLNDDEIQSFLDNCLEVGDGVCGQHYVFGGVDFARAIEAKLKEKNHD